METQAEFRWLRGAGAMEKAMAKVDVIGNVQKERKVDVVGNVQKERKVDVVGNVQKERKADVIGNVQKEREAGVNGNVRKEKVQVIGKGDLKECADAGGARGRDSARRRRGVRDEKKKEVAAVDRGEDYHSNMVAERGSRAAWSLRRSSGSWWRC